MPPKKTPVKKGPPLVYHSYQLMSLNGVDEMQEKYTYNAAVKMEERHDQIITVDIERLKNRLEHVQNSELVAKGTANKLIQAITSLNENELFEKVIIKKSKFFKFKKIHKFVDFSYRW
jgi:MFS superfamily sulfate permease-like transporter